jgi:hypothetical protein
MKTYVHLRYYLAEFFIALKIFQTKVAEQIKHILCSITFPKNCAVYETMWKNTAKPDRPQMTI